MEDGQLNPDVMAGLFQRLLWSPLLTAARSDSVLRDQLRTAAVALLRELERMDVPPALAEAPVPLTVEPVEPADTQSVTPAITAPPVEPTPPVQLEKPQPPRRSVTLRLNSAGPVKLDVPDEPARAFTNQGPVVVESARPAWTGDVGAFDDLDLLLIKRKCALKAESCRFAIERRADMGLERDRFLGLYRELISQAKSMPDCYLWAVDPNREMVAPADEVLERAAGCYDTLASVVALAHDLIVSPDGNDLLPDAFALLAEAGSMLRIEMNNLPSPLIDHDQQGVFMWLRRQVEWRHIYVARHMKLDDPAMPNNWADAQRRIGEVRQVWESRRSRQRDRQNMLGKGRYHARRVLDARGNISEDDLGKVSSAVDWLLQAGLSASSPELRDMVRPFWEELADRPLADGLRSVVEDLARPTSDEPPVAPRIRSQAVQQVARMLRGGAMVLVGGEPRDYSRRAIEQAFELSELLWLDAPVHESTSRFEPYCARADVRLVAVIIKLSSHSFGELKDFARRYGKAFIFLTHGYNPEQIARAVLDQCSRQLESLPAAAEI